jgi:hypothetical protein
MSRKNTAHSAPYERSSYLRTTAIGVLAVGFFLLTPDARATHNEPGKGKSAKASLVTAYEPCTNPNTTTSGLTPWQACSPPVRSDSVCGFETSPISSAATGRVKAKSQFSDVTFAISAKGLLLSCEGLTLCAVFSVRVSTDRCVQSPCTLVDLINVTGTEVTSCCTVTHGVCQVKSSINREILDALRLGERAGIQILGCGLRRVDGPDPLPTTNTLECGILAP